MEQSAEKKLRSFPALSRDVYQSFYSLIPRRNDDSVLSTLARKFNAPILDHIVQSEDYPTLKSVCEGRELPAYEAAVEFIGTTANELDSLLSDIGGDKGGLNTLEKLENAETKAKNELADLLERMQRGKEKNPQLEQSAVDAANKVESKHQQVEAVSKMIDADTAQKNADIADIIASAVSGAAEKAEEVQNIIGAWGDDPSNLTRSEVNTALLETVRKSDVLHDISKHLGRFREIFAQGKRNGYAYGRGEKYSLELGSDLSRALTSELALLASPLTMPLFLQKYQRRQIKQYQRREPIYKGKGDIICCLDESASTKGDPAAWGKAVALTLLEIAADGDRKFALIHFAGPGQIKTDIFRPGEYTVADRMRAAETFLNGGTSYDTPLRESMRLMQEADFEKADIVFISDGECAISESFQEELLNFQVQQHFTITGVLLDKGTPWIQFGLQNFCRNLYRTSELLGDEIVRKLIAERA